MDRLQMSLEQKIGQMVMVGFKTPTVSTDITTLLEKYHVGGIIYFRRNVESKEQVAQLSRELQTISRKQTEVPLFICIDQEGGMVARIDWDDITLIPGNMAIGATRNEQLAYEAARICGEELLRMGINMNFAPSVDVNNNPLNPVIGVRSYGENAELVSKMGVAQINGLQVSNVAATAKHFPGHGDTAVDSHHGLAAVPHDEARLMSLELAPFISAIEAGVDSIMTAHVMFPAFEPEQIPATLSRRVLTDLLRDRLGFDGVIVTDCLEMHAISKECGIAEGAVKSVEAGADLVLVSHTFAEQVAAIEALVAAVRSGRISEAQVDASVDRLLALKAKRRMEQIEEVEADFASQFGTPSSKAVVDDIYAKSITLVKDEAQLPLAHNEPTLVIWPEVRERTEVDEPIVQAYTLATALAPHLGQVEELRIGTYPKADEVAKVVEYAASFRQVVIVTYNAVSLLHEGQVSIVEQLAADASKRVVVASTRNPYDLNQFPNVKTYVCAYENRPATMKALADVLVGVAPAIGKLPVTISEQYAFDHGTLVKS
ncbi:beta-N-acetylhexosaminidase [Paenibacillus sp. 481]|uniref:beta-N-acetylhexosaminidase n=1 Tax=Paenibacillus sp. 481 TaxID=2835869 RepID=UPI001E4A6BD1|nr:beta-N-acetylhexosaminidase [Paenibacillus sp. 481]UHA72847.1 beta-N-acetylhexosaminidase [Paenibacillus sp. 481]